MRKFNIFTWIVLFFLVVGILASLTIDASSVIIPVVIIGLVVFFMAHPEKLNFKKKYQGNRYNRSNHNSNTNNRKTTFTVVDGQFKEVKNDKKK